MKITKGTFTSRQAASTPQKYITVEVNYNRIMNTLVNTLTKLLSSVMVATIAASDLLHSIGMCLISSLNVEIRLDLATPPVA